MLYDICTGLLSLGERMRTSDAIQVGRVFRALSNPTRLRILNLLLIGEVCVGDIVRALRIPQRTVIRHLAYLRRIDFLESRRDEHRIYYKLTEPQSGFHRQLIECLGCCFENVSEFAIDTAQLKLSRCC
jgi:ArsR family transcriptional regulator